MFISIDPHEEIDFQMGDFHPTQMNSIAKVAALRSSSSFQLIDIENPEIRIQLLDGAVMQPEPHTQSRIHIAVDFKIHAQEIAKPFHVCLLFVVSTLPFS